MTDIDNSAEAKPITADDDVDFLKRKVGRYTKREQALRDKMERIKGRQAPDGFSEQKLAVKPIEGFKLRWVNDRDNRVQYMLDRGWVFIDKEKYEPCNDETKSSIDKASYVVVGSKKDGSPLHAYLMGIEDEIYDYYYRRAQAENDRIMQDIERNLPKSQSGESNQHGYVKQAEGMTP